MADELLDALERAQRRLRQRPAGEDPAQQEVVTAFLAGLAEPTRSAYRGDLRALSAFLSPRGRGLLQATPGDLRAHVGELQSQGAAPGTIRRRLAAAAGLFRLAVARGLIDRDPTAGLARPRTPARATGPTTAAGHTRALLAAATTPRERALIALLALAGLGLGEALAADIGDLAVTGERTLLRVGGSRARDVVLPEPCAAACREAAAGRRTGPLLATASGGGLDRGHARRLVRRIGTAVDGADPVTPRALRRGFVAGALDAGVPPDAVGAAVGWSDPRTVVGHRRAPARPDAVTDAVTRAAGL